MPDTRLQATGHDSSFGDYLYEQVIPQDHLLSLLRKLVRWERYSHRLIKYCRGKEGVGRPPIKPAMVRKMLLQSCLYNLSERQTDDFRSLHAAASIS
jgi:hypothetical protein